MVKKIAFFIGGFTSFVLASSTNEPSQALATITPPTTTFTATLFEDTDEGTYSYHLTTPDGSLFDDYKYLDGKTTFTQFNDDMKQAMVERELKIQSQGVTYTINGSLSVPYLYYSYSTKQNLSLYIRPDRTFLECSEIVHAHINTAECKKAWEEACLKSYFMEKGFTMVSTAFKLPYNEEDINKLTKTPLAQLNCNSTLPIFEDLEKTRKTTPDSEGPYTVKFVEELGNVGCSSDDEEWHPHRPVEHYNMMLGPINTLLEVTSRPPLKPWRGHTNQITRFTRCDMSNMKYSSIQFAAIQLPNDPKPIVFYHEFSTPFEVLD